MRLKKIHRISLLVIAGTALASLALLNNPGRKQFIRFFRPDPSVLFDQVTGQKAVTTQAGIDSVLNRFPIVAYKDLPAWWKEYTENDKMKTEIANRAFLVIRGPERYRYVVAHHRIREFLPKDSTWFSCESEPDSNCVQYWLIQPKILHSFLSLLDSVEAQNYDPDAILVRNSYRHHRLNFVSGGAAKSRHRLGDAIDLQIADLDRNGKEELKDKDIVLQLLDKHIIRNSGGVGRYPSTLSLHMDLRGHRARWDSYKPANQQ